MSTSDYVIDTHALIWYFEDNHKLSPAAKLAFDNIERGQALGIVPTIVLAEIIHLAENKKTTINVIDTIKELKQENNFSIISLDLIVILNMVSLNKLEIHDRVIVATARSFEASLITRDEQIRSSNLVSCIW